MLKYNVYKVWLVDVMETGHYINLIIFSGGKLYLLRNGSNHAALSYVSATVASAMLLLIIIYHVVIKIPIPASSLIIRGINKVFAKNHRFSDNDLSVPFLDSDSSVVTLSHHRITCSVVDRVI